MMMSQWNPGRSVAHRAVDGGSPRLAFHPPGGGLLAWPHTPRRRSVVCLAAWCLAFVTLLWVLKKWSFEKLEELYVFVAAFFVSLLLPVSQLRSVVECTC